MFSFETIKRIIRQNLIREHEIAQIRTAQYLVFGFSSKENKLMWIEIPAEFVIQNNSPQRIYVLDSSYYGYAYEARYRFEENPAKEWSKHLLYRIEKDSIGSLIDLDPIFQKNPIVTSSIHEYLFIRILNFRNCSRIRSPQCSGNIRNPVGGLPHLLFPHASGSLSDSSFQETP